MIFYVKFKNLFLNSFFSLIFTLKRNNSSKSTGFICYNYKEFSSALINKQFIEILNYLSFFKDKSVFFFT